MLKSLLKKLFVRRTKYQPLIKVLVFANRLKNNYRLYSQNYPGLKFAPVLKSNAYGHGLWEVAEILKEQSPPFFVVDSYYEADFLRRRGSHVPLLIIGYSSAEQIFQNQFKDVAHTVISLEGLCSLAQRLNKPRLIHLKIDTGMHRQGVLYEEIPAAIELLKSNSNLVLEGVCSHLADADGASGSFTQKQIELWNQAARLFKQNFSGIKYFHLSATAGMKYAREAQTNAARLGIGLYGYGDLPGLEPALEMRTVVSSLKTLRAGESVGYNATFTAQKDMQLATLPVGYYEGLDRRLSNKGAVQIRGQACRIVGRVSMNITSVDAGSQPDAKVGDEVVVISGEAGAVNSAKSWAELCGTIPYEILIHIPQHLRREVV